MDTIGSHQQNSPVFDILQQIHDGKTHVGEYLSVLLKDFPVFIGWGHMNADKTNLIWNGCNFLAAKMMSDVSHQNEIVGKTTFDLCKREEEARTFIANDRYVINNNQPKLNSISPFSKNNGQSILTLSTTIPFRDKKTSIVGILDFFRYKWF